MRYLLLNVPTPLLILLIVGGSALITVAVTHFVRTHINEKIHRENNEVAGFIFAAVGVIYGVLLAFMVLVVQQSFENAQATVEHEANSLVTIYRLAQELPEPYRSELKRLAVEYGERVVNQEWEAMARGESSAEVDQTIEKVWELHQRLHTTKVELGSHASDFFQAVITLGNDRRIRLLQSRIELSSLLWVLLISGGILTIGFTLFLRAPNHIAHLLMAAMFAGLVAFVLLLIIELDNPFTGDVSVQPLAFQQALQLFARVK